MFRKLNNPQTQIQKNDKEKTLNKKPTYQISRGTNPCCKNHIFTNPDSKFNAFTSIQPSGLSILG